MPGADLPNVFATAGLYDPAAPDAEAWLELLVHLADRGVTIEQMRAAAARGSLASAAADLSLFDVGSPISLDEVAARCGVSTERVIRLRLAGGLPVEEHGQLPEWAPEDVAGFLLGAALFGEAPTLAFARVMGAAAGRVAEAAVALFLTEVNAELASAGARPVEWARANEEAASLVDVVAGIIPHLLREHLGLAINRQRASLVPATGPEVSVAIGFVDLAGSTEWAESLSIRAQADTLARFESAAWEITTRLGGRVVKLIGDEVMFASHDPVVACRIAASLCRAVDAEPTLPPARGAVGYGLVAARDGDYYGSMINLVARAVKSAGEGQVVVTAEVAERCRAAGEALATEPLGPTQLRGFERPVPLFALSPGAGRSGRSARSGRSG